MSGPWLSSFQRWMPVFILCLECIGCSNGGERSVVVESGDTVLLRLAVAGRSILPPPILHGVAPVSVLQIPNSGGWRYRLSKPVLMAAAPPPECRLFVGDPVDQAVHVFTVEGEYVKSYDLPEMTGDREASIEEMVAWGPGHLAVAVGNRGGVWLINHASEEWTQIQIPALAEEERERASVIAVSPDTTFFERPVLFPRPGDKPPNTLLRVWRPEGQLLASIGEPLQGTKSGAVSQVVNEGEISFFDGRVWFARYYDATLLGFPNIPGVRAPDSILRLPLFQALSLPRITFDTLDGSVFPSAPQNQVSGHAFSPDGASHFIQTISRGRRWAVASISSDGETFFTEVPGPARAVAAFARVLWICYNEIETGELLVVALPNPFGSFASDRDETCE